MKIENIIGQHSDQITIPSDWSKKTLSISAKMLLHHEANPSKNPG